LGHLFVEPVIAVRRPTCGSNLSIASADLIGCLNSAKDFIVSASLELFSITEGLWVPDLDLFETISQTLFNAVDRDTFSGWGTILHVM
ncbi:hypothetical protein K439DRAFT_1371905, partial [Ramaria rubella]